MKTKRLHLRLSYFEYSLIKGKAQQANKSMSEYVRDCSLGKQINITNKIDIDTYQLIASYHTNFKRISNLIRQNEEPQLKQELETTLKQIQTTLKYILNIYDKQSEEY